MHHQQNKYEKLRREYPFFVFESYHIHHAANTMLVSFSFNLADKVRFKPQFSIELNNECKNPVPGLLLNNLVFHIAMTEMISYWKAACSPKIIIKPFYLETHAQEWWKRLFYHGLGEFFYTNGIKPDFNDFLTFECQGQALPKKTLIDLEDTCLIPLGGGKDSVVTLDMLANRKMKVNPFFLNPTKAAIDVARLAGFDKNQSMIIKRTIDPELLRLNEHGFLNGHTPFSALLAFYSLIPAVMAGAKNIVLSNESSANEPSITGSEINHQYSKSFAFEKDFREYCRKYISADLNYFSFLRALNELQIAGLFSGNKKFHAAFRSCNAGSKAGVWCGKCPKCLFTFIILLPFFDPIELKGIFGHNLLDDPDLEFYFNQLCGLEKDKPFDCIGTIDEVNAALHAAVRKYDTHKLPALLQRYKLSHNYGSYNDKAITEMLAQFNTSHFISEPFLNLLKTRLNERLP